MHDVFTEKTTREVQKKMSKKVFDELNNIVDNIESEYYFVNKRKRDYWHAKSKSLSFRVRDKNEFNKSRDIALNVRCFLLGDRNLINKYQITMSTLHQKDEKTLRNYVYRRFSDIPKKELDEKMGLVIRSLEKEEIRAALHLGNNVATWVLGYEKEFFFLKCFVRGVLPAFMARTLYHTKFNVSEMEEELQEEFYPASRKMYKGLDFEDYISLIDFK